MKKICITIYPYENIEPDITCCGKMPTPFIDTNRNEYYMAFQGTIRAVIKNGEKIRIDYNIPHVRKKLTIIIANYSNIIVDQLEI